MNIIVLTDIETKFLQKVLKDYKYKEIDRHTFDILNKLKKKEQFKYTNGKEL